MVKSLVHWEKYVYNYNSMYKLPSEHGLVYLKEKRNIWDFLLHT
jgi:hypothetical protein